MFVRKKHKMLDLKGGVINELLTKNAEMAPANWSLPVIGLRDCSG